MKDTELYAIKELLGSPGWKILIDNVNIKIKHLENELFVFNKDLISIEQIKYKQIELKSLREVIETPEKLLKNRITKQTV